MSESQATPNSTPVDLRSLIGTDEHSTPFRAEGAWRGMSREDALGWITDIGNGFPDVGGSGEKPDPGDLDAHAFHILAEVAERSDRSGRIGKAVSDEILRMGEPFTSLMAAKYYAGYTDDEVAQALGCSPALIQLLVGVALDRLSDLLPKTE